MTPADLTSFIPNVVDEEGLSAPIATVTLAPVQDLFSEEPSIRASQQDGHPVNFDRGAFLLNNGLSLEADLRSVRSSHIQCLLAVLARQPMMDRTAKTVSTVIDPECGLVLWSNAPETATHAGNVWSRIQAAGTIDRATASTTPWLYGNKLRLTRFVAPVAEVTLPPDLPMLDLMSGTGIVARSLAQHHPMAVNDANPYAALLARSQWIDSSIVDFDSITERLRESFSENQRRLENLVALSLSRENDLFHGDVDDEALERFQREHGFVLPLTGGEPGGTSRLFTERYAGVYFGIAQSIEIDSLRHAVDRSFPEPGVERDICLSALISACVTCASGPHFAQPATPKSVKALRKILERRARSVAWEFELAMDRLAARESLPQPLLSATCDSWRGALTAFRAAVPGEAAVYIDPPYSKLQYSRYYHVLNVLLAYNYPPVSGRGRYPPRQDRFSSRFEYQPAAARRELREMIQACADAGLTTLLSYGDAGFVSIESLLADMRDGFGSVEVFTEALRHHSQGRSLATPRSIATEYLMVGKIR